MQIIARKNTAYYLCFPMVDTTSPCAFKSGITPSVAAYSKDTTGSWASLSLVDTPAEIGSTGIYEIDLAASELNHDKALLKITGASAAETAYLFDLRNGLAEDSDLYAQSVSAMSGSVAMWTNIIISTSTTASTASGHSSIRVEEMSHFERNQFNGCQAVIHPGTGSARMFHILENNNDSGYTYLGFYNAAEDIKDFTRQIIIGNSSGSIPAGARVYILPNSNHANTSYFNSVGASMNAAQTRLLVSPDYWIDGTTGTGAALRLHGPSGSVYPAMSVGLWSGSIAPPLAADGYLKISGSDLLDSTYLEYVEEDYVMTGSVMLRDALNALTSVNFGKVTGAGTATITFRNVLDTLNRVVATVDSSGNRTAITLAPGGSSWS